MKHPTIKKSLQLEIYFKTIVMILFMMPSCLFAKVPERRQEIIFYLFGEHKALDREWIKRLPRGATLELLGEPETKKLIQEVFTPEFQKAAYGGTSKAHVSILIEKVKQTKNAVEVHFVDEHPKNGTKSFAKIQSIIRQIVRQSSVRVLLDLRGAHLFDSIEMQGDFKENEIEKLLLEKFSFNHEILKYIWNAAIPEKKETSKIWLISQGLINFGMPELSLHDVPFNELENKSDLLLKIAHQLVTSNRLPTTKEKYGEAENLYSLKVSGSFQDNDFWGNIHLELKKM